MQMSTEMFQLLLFLCLPTMSKHIAELRTKTQRQRGILSSQPFSEGSLTNFDSIVKNVEDLLFGSFLLDAWLSILGQHAAFLVVDMISV